MNLLVVDGSELIQSRLAERLSRIPGVTGVVTRGTIRQAMGCLERGLFDLAILDLNLPDGTSSAVIAAMKQVCRNLVVVILSNNADEFTRRMCQRAGADCFFDKSLEFDRMIQTTENLAASTTGKRILSGGNSMDQPSTLPEMGSRF